MALPAGTPSVIRFGAFELDAANGELRKAGVYLKIHPQPLQVLLLLAQKAGQIVTREEIQRCLWGENTFVDFERGINFCVNQIRAALGDDAEKPRYVETLPRRGYRFIAAVTKDAAPDSPTLEDGTSELQPDGAPRETKALPHSRTLTPTKKRNHFLTAFGLLMVIAAVAAWRWHAQRLVTPIRSLAVLPLANLSGNSSQDYFADGITEALITELGKVSALRVISRQSTTQYKGSKKSVPEIARELNVDAVVEGSVLLDADRVRVSVQLIQAAPERHLWAESYDRQRRDVLALDGEVARAVAREIKITVTPEEETRLAGTRTVNPAASEAYFRGRYFLDRRTKADIDEGLAAMQPHRGRHSNSTTA